MFARLLLLAALGVSGRALVGVQGNWAAFRDASPHRCYAISEPFRGARGGDRRPYFAVGYWPDRGSRPQVQVRLSRTPRAGAPVVLSVGDRRFTLLGGGGDAWAASALDDLRIVAMMRSATSLSVESRGRGGAFADGYALAGAPTAIDAAALACAG